MELIIMKDLWHPMKEKNQIVEAQKVNKLIHTFNFRLGLFGLLVISPFMPGNVLWSQSQTFTSSGTFTVPAGVSGITVEAWGAGGGGSDVTRKWIRGGGGGGGAFASSIISVSPGETYVISVGQGGAADTDGGNSSFNSTTVVAAGGEGAEHGEAERSRARRSQLEINNNEFKT